MYWFTHAHPTMVSTSLVHIYIRGYIVYFNDIMTVSPHPWSLSLPLVVRVAVQYGGGHTDWLHPEECLTTDDNQNKYVHVYMNMLAIKSLLYIHTLCD